MMHLKIFSLFARSSIAYLRRHKVQGLLMITGITIGVAVVVSIDLANSSSARALELSTEAVAGKATHQILAPPSGLDMEIYASIIQSGLPIKAAPIVSGIVTSDQLGGTPLQLIGLDPFVDQEFRNYTGNLNNYFDTNASQFFTTPGAVLISSQSAVRNNLEAGDFIEIVYGGSRNEAYIAGIITASDDYQIRTLEGLIISDISTAQEILAKDGKIDRIDLILPAGSELLPELSEFLPAPLSITSAEARSSGLDQLTSAFQINLSALSFLAMLVGMFLIYNTMTFSIVQRRSLFGVYRCLGVTRREIFTMVLIEAAVIGIFGSILGLLAGIALGQFTVGMVSQTVNDLYFTTTVNSTEISAISLIKGFIIGFFTTIVTTIPPAWEASSVSPREAMSRYSVEHRSRRSVWQLAVAGLIAFILGYIAISIPSTSLIIGFIAIGFVTIGFSMITSLTMVLILKGIQPLTTKINRLTGRLAPRNLLNSLSRTSVAVSALMVAIAVSIGVGLMISSFRGTVDAWLRTSLQGDVYVTAPSFISNQPMQPVDQSILPYLEKENEIDKFFQLKISNIESRFGEIQIAATDNYLLPNERVYKSKSLPENEIWQAMSNGAIIITESLAYRLGLPLSGASIELATNEGFVQFPVVAVYYDFASTSGTIQIPLDVYRRYWDDQSISAIGINLKAGVDSDDFGYKLQSSLTSDQSLLIRSNRELRQDVMVVFDRTFAITRALQLLAMIVAFIGILSALGLLQFERQREMGIIRALGLTNREVWSLAMFETFLMGIISGIMAIPTGYTLAVILVGIINQRSFGWSMKLILDPDVFLQAVLIAIFAAVLAGIFPAWRMSRMQAVEAIRYE